MSTVVRVDRRTAVKTYRMEPKLEGAKELVFVNTTVTVDIQGVEQSAVVSRGQLLQVKRV